MFVWCNHVLPGAAFVDIMRSNVYFGGADTAHALTVMAAWLAAGIVLVAGAALVEHRRGSDAVGAGAAAPRRRLALAPTA